MKTLTTDFSSVAVLDDAAARWQQRRVKSSFAAMRRRWWLIVLFACIGLGGTATWLTFAKPQYTATVLVQLDMRNKFSSFDAVVASPREGDPNLIRTEVEVLQSNTVAQKVVAALDLTNDPEFTPRETLLAKVRNLLPPEITDLFRSSDKLEDRSSEDELMLTIQEVAKHLSLTPGNRSYIISVGFSASSAKRAALIANTFAEQYLATQSNAKKSVTASANEWAKIQLDNASEQLEKAESAIEQFRAQHGAIIELAPGNTSVSVTHQLTRLNSELAAAAEVRISAETQLAAARELVKRNQAYTIPQVLASPLVQQLRIEEARATGRLAQLEPGLGSQHPEAKAAVSEQSRLRDVINSKVQHIVAGLASTAQSARVREQDIESKVEALRKDAGVASQEQFQLSILERRAEARRAFHAELEKRYVETSALLHGAFPDARIADRATPPTGPSWPNVPLFIVAGLLVGAAIGAAIAALLDLADKSFRTPTQLEEATGLPCLGILPDLGPGFHRRKGHNLSAASTRIFREAVRTICIAVDAAMGVNNQKKGRVILITSALPHEGKTVSSVALATALAASGSKTLLIDADLRRPQMRTYLPSMSRAQDLASILAEGDSYPTATAIDKKLYAISGGNADENAQQVFLSPQFGNFIEAARAEFDTIVIDSPPVMVVADAAILARFADVVLHVTRWGQTPRSTVLAAVDRMRRANGRSVGVTMLNRVAPAKYKKYNRDGVWSFKYADYYQPATRTTAVKHYPR
jgi:succinoglycan biosynthesis transport protein ExoP